MGKTIAERLRECDASNGWTCWGSVLAEIMGDGECSCPEDTGDRSTCHVCYERQLRKLADAIEAEKSVSKSTSSPLVVMPHDADGEPCWLDDAVWYEGRKHLIVAVSHKGKVCIRDWETRDSGEGAVWVEAKHLTHRKPDTQEAIEADAAKAACLYFHKGNLYKCSDCPQGNGDGVVDYRECCIAQTRDLLRRQRKLLGGER